ncbi:MAG: YneF family protein [Acholeplasmataceae bacterium]|jgi:uncharacterized protein YneF (UPF0154 family)|nr:YneF family protein [Acholeplasmataceae bacterium]
MLELKIWVFILILVGVLIVGLVAGFFLARAWFKRYLEKNPPITEQMVREMMRQMGRTPSERQVRQVMASMNPTKTSKKKK